MIKSKRVKVLHLEDEIIVCDLVKELLNEDYDYEAVQTEEAAIKLLGSKKYDVLLLDLRLTKEKKVNGFMDGLHVVKFIKDRGLSIKVVIVSALSEESKKAMIDNKLVIKAIVNKPFTKNQLINAINKALN